MPTSMCGPSLPRFRELPDAGHLFGSMARRGDLVEASVDFLLAQPASQDAAGWAPAMT